MDYGNGVIRMGRYSDVECETPDEKDGNFFKAELDYKSAKQGGIPLSSKRYTPLPKAVYPLA